MQACSSPQIFSGQALHPSFEWPRFFLFYFFHQIPCLTAQHLVVLLVIEIITLGLSTIWFAGGALAAFIAALLGADLYLEIILFLAVSLVLLLFTRPVVMRYLNANKTATNVDSLIGEQAIVTKPINNLLGQGEVMVGGTPWSARSAEENGAIEKDAIVRVLKVDGVKLIVERKENVHAE